MGGVNTDTGFDNVLRFSGRFAILDAHETKSEKSIRSRTVS